MVVRAKRCLAARFFAARTLVIASIVHFYTVVHSTVHTLTWFRMMLFKCAINFALKTCQ